MIFKYRAYSESGESVNSTITAANLVDARYELERGGLLIESIKEQKTYFTPKIDNAKLALVSRNISIYLRSGMSLMRAIDLIKENYKKDPKFKNFLEALSKELKEGKSFFEAFNQQKIFKIPPFFLYTIEVSEKSSSLENSLLELSGFISTTEKLKREVAKAFIYPGFIILIAVGMISFMLTSIVPKIVDIFESSGNELPPATQFTLTVSHFMQDYAFYIFSAFVVFTIALTITRLKSYSFRKMQDKFVLKMPLLGSIMLHHELSMFARVSSLLLESGVPFAQSIHFSTKIFSNVVIKDGFKEISKKIIEGKSFTNAVASQKEIELPPDFLNAIAIGENSSELPYTLKTLAEFYELTNRDKIEVLLSLLEPILMLVVGGIIGFLVISMLLPIFSISVG
ncbi:MAG: hypothetical protein GQ570_08650 [Helicobacteraceae bacterium]|nr:hypothetical protein [Helicobacteraceae bacterium]